MQPEIWGRHFWNVIHILTLSYPNNPTRKDIENHKQFFDSLGKVLPCDKCRLNFSSHMKNNRLTDSVLSSKQSFVKWGIDLHNTVNYHTGKEVLSYRDAMIELTNLVSNKRSYENIYFLIFCFSLFCVILYILNKKLK